jgi:hypothetical protein
VDAQQTSNVSQILQWLNGLTLPTLLGAAFAAARWITKKEDAAKSLFAGIQRELSTLRDNHLHHMQESLDRIEQGQSKMIETLNLHTREIVASQNQSTTAIVQAILTLKN